MSDYLRASWEAQEINNRRLEVMKSCRQTKPATGFSLIIRPLAKVFHGMIKGYLFLELATRPLAKVFCDIIEGYFFV